MPEQVITFSGRTTEDDLVAEYRGRLRSRAIDISNGEPLCTSHYQTALELLSAPPAPSDEQRLKSVLLPALGEFIGDDGRNLRRWVTIQVDASHHRLTGIWCDEFARLEVNGRCKAVGVDTGAAIAMIDRGRSQELIDAVLAALREQEWRKVQRFEADAVPIRGVMLHG